MIIDIINTEIMKLAIRLITDPSVTEKMRELARKSVSQFDASKVTENILTSPSTSNFDQHEQKAVNQVNAETIGTVDFGDNNAFEGNIGDVAGRDISKKADETKQEKVVEKDLMVKNIAVPYGKAFDTLAHSTTVVVHQLEKIYSETREQAQGWFRFSLIAAGVGFVLVGAGLIVVLLGQQTIGLITALSSAIPNAIAGLFFLQSKAANERVDAVQEKLSENRQIQTAIEVANTISDKKARDKLKAEIARKVMKSSTTKAG